VISSNLVDLINLDTTETVDKYTVMQVYTFSCHNISAVFIFQHFIAKALAQRLCAFDTGSLKNTSNPVYSTRYQRFCQGDCRLLCSFKYH